MKLCTTTEPSQLSLLREINGYGSIGRVILLTLISITPTAMMIGRGADDPDGHEDEAGNDDNIRGETQARARTEAVGSEDK